MKLKRLSISHFKSIEHLVVDDIDRTLILVGPNNVGKSAVLGAIKILTMAYEPEPFDFHANNSIEIEAQLSFDEEDLENLHALGKVSRYHDFSRWLIDFQTKIPTYDNNELTITCRITKDGIKRYSDGVVKHNPYLLEVLPNLYIINEQRNIEKLYEALLYTEQGDEITEIKNNTCIFDVSKVCNDCFVCIGMIHKKTPEELTLHESILLLKYKLSSRNLQKYTDMVNRYFKLNYGQDHIIEYQYAFDYEQLLAVNTVAKNLSNNYTTSIENVSNSFKSIYILSLLQAYIELEQKMANLIIVEQPELHLHPQLQKVTSEILYRLSKKNQVFFSTHSPHMLLNFKDRQICQVALNEDHKTVIKHPTDVDRILEELGQSANDMMHVDFVFIVEGKDDRTKLPMLLNRYYDEIQEEDGSLQRIAIIPTNSCTNIKTYANLKFINKTYLKENFMIIRDSDGHDPDDLAGQLVSYYDQRRVYDDAKIPRINRDNILVLPYYSIENYFLDPEIMVKIGVIKTVESFYEILYSKYRQYLYKLRSTKKMVAATKLWFTSPEDMKLHMETIKTYIRGHNLFDIYYGGYNKDEQAKLIQAYIDLAPRSAFSDILDAVDRFVYFENRRRKDN